MSDTTPGHQPTPPPVGSARTPAIPTGAETPRRWIDALLDSVAVGKRISPLWVPVTALVAIFAAGAGLFGLVVGLSVQSAEQFAREQSEAAVAEARPAVVSDRDPPAPSQRVEKPPPPKSLVQRASAGEHAALETLAAKEEKSTDEALALARGRISERRRHAAELRDKIVADPTLVKNEELLKELVALGRDDNTAVEALAAIASLPGPTSADLLYEIWTETPERTDATQLAETLVYSRDVFPKASDALKVALELRAAETCEENKSVLERAVEHADRRSLHLVSRLQRKFGCGQNERQDCYKCLREGTLVKDAMAQARKKPAPKYGG